MLIIRFFDGNDPCKMDFCFYLKGKLHRFSTIPRTCRFDIAICEFGNVGS